MAFGSRFGLGAALVLAVVTAVAPPRAHAQDASRSAAPQADDLNTLIATLNNQDPNNEKQRDEAARRIASRATPEARAAVINSLRDLGNPAAQLSMAKALAEATHPDPQAVDPLFAMMDSQPLAEAAAKALANYKDQPGVLTRLINIAQARNRSEWARVPVIRAIGTLVEKRAAEFLINTTRSRDENQAIINAAADALVTMTGLTENGRDLQRWERWWQANSAKNDNDFRNDILASRVAAFDQLKARYLALSSEVYALLKDAYVAAPDAQKKEMVLRYLRNTKPEVRAVGAQLVFEDKIIDARVIPPEVQEELRKMVGDSATNVRLQVAKTLGALNDPAALQPLLTQLAQETDPDVRAAIATALGPIRDLKAVPPLLNVVNDDSFAVARAAADALKELGPKLRDDNPNLASQTAARLNEVLQKTEGKTGAQELRESLVEAMATLRQHDLMRTFQGLLNQNESVRVRRAALKGLGEIGDPKAADMIVPSLTDQQSAIRLEAVLAMGKVATVENADAIANRVDPQQESDESVRGEAWKVFQSLLPQMEPPRLQAFADRFSKDPNQRLVILSQLADKQLKTNDVDGLALTRENLGQVSMQLNDPKAAAIYYQQALSAHENDTGTVKERLVQNTTNALLQSKQYPEAAKFASDLLKKSNEFQDIVGSSFRDEAERLNKANDPTSALEVIKEADTIDPPLAPKYRQQLQDAKDAAQKMAKNPSSDSTPRSAGSIVPNTTAGAAE